MTQQFVLYSVINVNNRHSLSFDFLLSQISIEHFLIFRKQILTIKTQKFNSISTTTIKMASYEQMESSRFACCCGPCRTHVETGAYVIAFLGAALNIFQAIYNFLPSNGTHHQNISSGVLCILFALMHLSIICAQRKRNPTLYLPYLIFVGIGLAVCVVIFLALFGIAIVAPETMIEEMRKQFPDDKITVEYFRMVFGLGALSVALGTLLNAWFYSVVYRAYKYMKEQGQSFVPAV